MRPSPLALRLMTDQLEQSRAEVFGTRTCAVCKQASLVSSSRRFGGRRVCLECWQGLARLERSGPFRQFPRASILDLFAAEVAVRQPRLTS